MIKRGRYIDSEREAEARGIFVGGFVLRLEAKAIFSCSFVVVKAILIAELQDRGP